MKQISELQTILSDFLDWNKPRIICLVQTIHALFRVRTVNLTQIAEGFQTSAKEASTYRRLQRFFKSFSFDMSFIVILVAKLFIGDAKCVLIMDRTNWQWGKKHINILMVSIEHYGIGIPLFWTVLDRAGGSSSKDRMDLLKKVIKRLGPENIQVLLADREFIGIEWFRFLTTENIPFVIRVKQSFMVGGIRQGYDVPVGELLKKLSGKKRHINHPVVLWGYKLFASIEYAKGKKEPLIVVSNKPFPNPLTLYRQRWGIETLFGCLKSRGFRMEDTHMVDPIKIEKLTFILAIAFCWAYKTGEITAKLKPIEVKKHGRKAKSIFRLGLNLIRSKLLWLEEKIDPHLSLLKYFTALKPWGFPT